jgi:hypothetical protein
MNVYAARLPRMESYPCLFCQPSTSPPETATRAPWLARPLARWDGRLVTKAGINSSLTFAHLHGASISIPPKSPGCACADWSPGTIMT